MSRATDIIQVADLIKMAAETARMLVDSAPANAAMSFFVADALLRIEEGADDLSRAVQNFKDDML